VTPTAARPIARGKFLLRRNETWWIRGVTYGTFRPSPTGDAYGSPEIVERDFAQIASHGLNAVRTYTVPPRWLLDAAHRHELRVMVDVPWEQHVTFLDDRDRARAIEARVAAGVAACAGHPAVLWYAIGNEIPGPIVRWHGRRAVERYLERLYRAARAEDPHTPVTYVNFPTTEYLDLPFLDVVAFNVYLEARAPLDAYLARLHNLAGDRPVVLTEVGLDSRRHGELAQARVLDWQLRTAFAAGCAGVFVFAWTDEWHRGGHDIQGWDFGLTRRDRRPKPALAAVRHAVAEVPFPKDRPWPSVSVVVCSYNGARTIRDCLDGLLRLEYPAFEVIVVDDGSTDGTGAIAREYGFRVIGTPNRGLSSARNTGLAAASGELVAYLDDDAWPEPHWLQFLAEAFLRGDYVGVGGPNLPPPGHGLVADCVANAPGGPIHVLLTDREAEHLPGCNMAFRRTALQAVGGFDPGFRVAGDDVDLCWRLQESGGKLGFHPGAVVWHRRRDSIRAYWRQQRGYGRAEALLERKWPARYNDCGHVAWRGRVYGPGMLQVLGRWRERVYHGTWGSAPFQSLYGPPAGWLAGLLSTPEWHLWLAAMGVLALLGLDWPPLGLAGLLFLTALGATLVRAVHGAARARLAPGIPPAGRLARRTLTAWLHLLQPLARLRGRLGYGLTPWRGQGGRPRAAPWPRRAAAWQERWETPTATLAQLSRRLAAAGATVRPGGEFDRWDLEARVGTFGAARLLVAMEEHGSGRQLVRLRAWPRGRPGWLALGAGLALLAAGAAADGAPVAAAVLAAAALAVAGRVALDCGSALALVGDALRPAEAAAPLWPWPVPAEVETSRERAA
jgi:GT2 family glycosyltransferase